MDVNLELADVSEAEMYALANFVKRIGHVEYKQNAESDGEANQIAIAVSALASALDRAGYEVW